MLVKAIKNWYEEGKIKYRIGKEYDININVSEYPYNEYFVAIACETCVHYNGAARDKILDTRVGKILYSVNTCDIRSNASPSIKYCYKWENKKMEDE